MLGICGVKCPLFATQGVCYNLEKYIIAVFRKTQSGSMFLWLGQYICVE